MENLAKILQMRAAPGILIFDLDGKLLYLNDSAQKLTEGGPHILDEVLKVCGDLRRAGGEGGINPGGEARSVLDAGPEGTFALRAFYIGGLGPDRSPTHVMVLTERVIVKHCVNLDKAQADYMLSKREVEVLALVCEGLANRDISERLFISEYTVKDHLKKIMRKMKAGSRSEIMAALGG